MVSALLDQPVVDGEDGGHGSLRAKEGQVEVDIVERVLGAP